MRKVYQPSGGGASLLASWVIAVSAVAAIFCVIPFSHLVAKPSRTLELRKTSVADLPPPKEEEPPPPPPPDEANREEIAPPVIGPDAPPPMPMVADLDVAVGSGGVLPGFVSGAAAADAEVGSALDSFDVSELERRPELVSQVAPTYPAELRKSRVEGSVTIVFLLTEDGRVEDARVENSSRPEFEKPALDAVRRWRFRPGMKDGQAVRTHMRLPVRFRMASS